MAGKEHATTSYVPGAEVDTSIDCVDVICAPNTNGVQSDVTVTVAVSLVHLVPG